MSKNGVHMDDAKDKVVSYLNHVSKSMTTVEIANSLNLSRSVISNYLNTLFKENRIKKISGRPIRWSKNCADVSERTSSFCNFIGYDGSMKHVIEQVSAAVAYPPNGLNILITGNSGVGKSFLAKKIYEYAKQIKIIRSNSPYFVLNCADYANNPELVSSMLFGYVKGAYTGADSSHNGLLLQANGGYLFLDEVHRLSSENQEKLFSFIDNGLFYQIGDNSHPIKSNVRLIMATTERPTDTLLTTFLRRIPIHVTIPDFLKRSIDERLTLLRYIIHQEAVKLNKKIYVNNQVVSALVQTNNRGNIGYLKNLIQIACSIAYKKQYGLDQIDLSMDSLLIDKLPNFEDYGDLLIDGLSPFIFNEKNSLKNAKFAQLMTEFHKLTVDFSSDNVQKVKSSIRKINQLLENSCQKTGLYYRHQELFKKIIEQQFGLNKTSYLEPLMFLFYEAKFCIDNHDLEPLYHHINILFSRSLHVAVFFYKNLDIEDKVKQSLIIVLAMLLSDHVDENITIRGLMIAHGKNTATSIQTVVNSLCGNYLFDAIDMPINVGVSSIIQEANALIDTFNTTKGFILMVDMGSLSQLYSEISSHINGDLLVVNNLTTITALDLALKMQQKMTFQEITNRVDQGYNIDTQYFEGVSQNINILVSCVSGLGIAEKISELFQTLMPDNIQIVPVDYSTLKYKIMNCDWNYFKQTILVLTTVDIDDKIPFDQMNIYDLLDATGERKLNKCLSQYLSQDKLKKLNQKLLRFFSKEGISEKLSFLNPDVILKEVEDVNSKYEDFYHLKLDGKIKLNLYLHIALMIERLIVHNTKDISIQAISNEEKDFFKITKSIFQPLEMKYNIHIPNYELSLLYELFRQFIK